MSGEREVTVNAVWVWKKVIFMQLTRLAQNVFENMSQRDGDPRRKIETKKDGGMDDEPEEDI